LTVPFSVAEVAVIELAALVTAVGGTMAVVKERILP
jgi:hypothetical protein